MIEPHVAPLLRGLVLAGGRSERLGRDKAAVMVSGLTLLDRAVSLLSPFVTDVHVSVRSDQREEPLRRRFALITDEMVNIGPAAGVIAAHRFDPGAAWLVVACDLAGVSADLLSRLVAGRDASRAATALRIPGADPEPLCAIYEPDTLRAFRRQVEAGGNPSPRDWLMAAQTALLDAPDAEALRSINTPRDLDRLAGL